MRNFFFELRTVAICASTSDSLQLIGLNIAPEYADISGKSMRLFE